MTKSGDWFVGNLPGNKRRALCRAGEGAFVAVQARGGGAVSLVELSCSEEVFTRMVENQGEALDADLPAIRIVGAMEIPAGLADALLA